MQKNFYSAENPKDNKGGSSSSRQPFQKARNPCKAKHNLAIPETNSDSYSDSFEEDSSSSSSSQKISQDSLRSEIISRINSLSQDKLSSVLTFLDSLEPKHAPGRPKPVIHKGKRPYSGKVNEHSNELEIKVISTWGHAHLAGITEIELFTSNHELIKITQNMIQIRNSGTGALSNPAKMIDGEKRTDDDKHM